jgi:hypothetical protein
MQIHEEKRGPEISEPDAVRRRRHASLFPTINSSPEPEIIIYCTILCPPALEGLLQLP